MLLCIYLFLTTFDGLQRNIFLWLRDFEKVDDFPRPHATLDCRIISEVLYQSALSPGRVGEGEGAGRTLSCHRFCDHHTKEK